MEGTSLGNIRLVEGTHWEFQIGGGTFIVEYQIGGVNFSGEYQIGRGNLIDIR